jgi:hypothetical protein
VSDNGGALRRHPAGYRERAPLRVLEDASGTRVLGSELVNAYRAHLERSPLSASTRLIYGRQVRRYFEWR